ncbi:MAG: metabolite traffic protein EboE [Planctomycetes bacterium]|nr:metabolite traffic protein EboE [Planctomycetota bacterium]
MRDVFGAGTVLGYCTNVHAGADWASTRANLLTHATAVKAIVSPEAPMGVGLWLSVDAVSEIVLGKRGGELQDLLEEHGLLAYTLNGFPYGDFHQPIVKRRVYEPDWTDPDRLAYTCNLAAILATLLAPGDEGSVSTLPIGWPAGARDAERMSASATALREVVGHLEKLEETTGRLVHVDLEPEPGCLLQFGADVEAFFGRWFASGADGDRARRYLRVCHDVCHAAVMFEEQEVVLRAYAMAGIRVGKVQLSNAVAVDLETFSADHARAAALEALSAFGEDRYLHQTTVAFDDEVAFFEDLPTALADGPRRGQWRVHYHVPVFVDGFGPLATTQCQLAECIALAPVLSDVRHYEVETYAWGVLPEALRGDDLAAGIARELEWVRSAAAAGRCS